MQIFLTYYCRIETSFCGGPADQNVLEVIRSFVKSYEIAFYALFSISISSVQVCRSLHFLPIILGK